MREREGEKQRDGTRERERRSHGLTSSSSLGFSIGAPNWVGVLLCPSPNPATVTHTQPARLARLAGAETQPLGAGETEVHETGEGKKKEKPMQLECLKTRMWVGRGND